MATLNDIKTVTSTSAENYSMLVLEFEQSTNMDSAVVDILQKTQMLTGRWDDSIGTPSIIRINPNMIPVMVAAVDSSEMDRYELSRFAKDTVIPALEGTTGVASITTGGMIERTMTIEVNEAKLDKMNAKIAEAIDKAMEDARKQLEDAQKELDENREKVEAGTNQLLSASSGISDSIKQGEDDLADTLTAAADAGLPGRDIPRHRRAQRPARTGGGRARGSRGASGRNRRAHRLAGSGQRALCQSARRALRLHGRLHDAGGRRTGRGHRCRAQRQGLYRSRQRPHDEQLKRRESLRAAHRARSAGRRGGDRARADRGAAHADRRSGGALRSARRGIQKADGIARKHAEAARGAAGRAHGRRNEDLPRGRPARRGADRAHQRADAARRGGENA